MHPPDERGKNRIQNRKNLQAVHAYLRSGRNACTEKFQKEQKKIPQHYTFPCFKHSPVHFHQRIDGWYETNVEPADRDYGLWYYFFHTGSGWRANAFALWEAENCPRCIWCFVSGSYGLLLYCRRRCAFRWLSAAWRPEFNRWNCGSARKYTVPWRQPVWEYSQRAGVIRDRVYRRKCEVYCRFHDGGGWPYPYCFQEFFCKNHSYSWNRQRGKAVRKQKYRCCLCGFRTAGFSSGKRKLRTETGLLPGARALFCKKYLWIPGCFERREKFKFSVNRSLSFGIGNGDYYRRWRNYGRIQPLQYVSNDGWKQELYFYSQCICLYLHRYDFDDCSRQCVQYDFHKY